jgi:hypothetical protein
MADVAIRAAFAYLRNNRLVADNTALAACLKANIRARIDEAMADAKAAFACGMREAAQATFNATIALAGIDAAKECGRPPYDQSEHPMGNRYGTESAYHECNY